MATHETDEPPPRGPRKTLRDDGSLLMEANYEGGLLQGPFRRFHRDGKVSREGRYHAGLLDGVVVAHISETGKGEPLRGCCVPLGAVRMEANYEHGALHGETFFDVQGYPLLSDGGRRPACPATVPAAARFDEHSHKWFHGPHDRVSGNSVGTWTWWTQDGALDEEVDFDDGRRLISRRFGPQATLVEVTHFLRHEGYEQIVHGLWRRLLVGDERVAWGVPDGVAQAAWVQGHFDRAASVGLWSLQTDSGALLWQRDLGLPVVDDVDSSSLAFDDEPRSNAQWQALAQQLERDGHVRESLVAFARAVGTGADVSSFLAFVKAHTLPKSATVQSADAEAVLAGAERGVGKLLDALVRGALALDILRALSTTVLPWSAAARDLSEACVRMAPADLRSVLTRALVRLERAEDKGLEEDLVRLGSVQSEAELFFRQTLAVFRPAFSFAPVAHVFAPLEQPIPLEVAQPFEAVLHMIAVYATRLSMVCEGLSGYTASRQSWWPPAMQALMPHGLVPLRKETVVIEDEDEDGNLEETTVVVDETLQLGGVGVGALIHRARVDWTGLCWLLWAVGCDDLRLPTHVESRDTFPQALSMAVQRAWRARDQVVTSGLRSMTQGAEDFEWEGHSVADLPSSLLDVCVAEWIEARAVLLWLSNPGNVSSFQDDLRHV